ncbi:unnamed protein product [Paramecium sonneborni]|uniref:Uncharacterized protein n=1 Tax=Paramecium sonneborni TaxID=65129 RepID=A0A8S1NKU7_9CILI|nr:unnamed protein product [Paramecium sonneborni]
MVSQKSFWVSLRFFMMPQLIYVIRMSLKKDQGYLKDTQEVLSISNGTDYLEGGTDYLITQLALDLA